MIKHRKTFESWLPAAFDGEFKWDFLLAAWKGTKIQPMDFDAVVERNSKFLVFETKKPGKKIDLGQKISLTAIWRNGKTSVIMLSGKEPEEINQYQTYWEWEKDKTIQIGDKPLINGDAHDVVFEARRWFCWADGKSIKSRSDWDIEYWQWDNQRKEKENYEIK